MLVLMSCGLYRICGLFRTIHAAYPVFLIHKNYPGFMVRPLVGNQATIGNNYYSITDVYFSGSCAVYAYFARIAWNRIGNQACTIVDIEHVDLLMSENVSSFHQLPVNGDTSLVIDTGRCYGSPVNLALQHYPAHCSSSKVQ